MKLSIIIPIYNVEDTLRRCLESVLGQMDDRMEVIIVDDGSTDTSGQIAEQMTGGRTDCRFIRQANKGLSAARNAGIEAATGEYITFADSDDLVAKGTYTALLAVLEEHPAYDILEYPIMEHYGHPTKQHLLTFPDAVVGSIRDYWLCGGHLHTYACNKLYRRELFADIHFPEGKAFEDAYTYPFLLQRAKVVATTSVGRYYYCHNDRGITAQAGGKELTDLLEAHLTHLHLWGRLTRDYYQALLNIQMDVYEATHAVPVLPVLPYKGTLKLFVLHLIGLKRLCQLNRFIHRIRKRSRS
ncbi:glycosyltransferase family 2 protein [Prevotella denticola]|uniref:glycosyltransferase family 2 protein n=1 Tax=Prevotella denticola TaxID=28129 RepID=UPI001C6059E5|nr:glycosyltransferase family 2 protein [Prevotella denticola]MBW4714061.1 glycosyltransferase [Prevotella denticola]MBW4751683.1 glycosyltransferase [Prevotella denticola]